MESYYRYLPTSEEADRWGLTLLNVGCGAVQVPHAYPHQQHPAPYAFNWQHGRILDEYQLIYISAGQGTFESTAAGTLTLEAGALILLFPGEWHRYKPDVDTGWIEYWIGFKGPVMDALIDQHFFNRTNPIFQLGARPDVINLYEQILAQAKAEPAGYQPLVGGMVLHLLGLVLAINKQQVLNLENHEQQALVQRAMVLIRENTETKITLEHIAEELKISYSLFRKIFKRHTGIAPGQYFTQLKIDRAKEYLLFSNLMIKEIAYALNFESAYYFSKFFKEKTGLSPVAFKKAYRVS